ncbi:MAG: hypothetical protein CMJ64_22225 [Planctomycetaceae bacterium]|jgi:hypothetical protein|nr:hypothetical protein [Planctomycetaceae bacterium]
MTVEVSCRGLRSRTINRRAFLETTVSAGMVGLSLPTLLGRRAQADEQQQFLKDTAVIQVWLGGGPTHFETYDPKPNAPPEYRGPFQPISTCLPGVQICELLPRHAKILDRVAVLRSVDVGSSGHDVGMYICTTGKRIKNQPSTGSYVAKIRSARPSNLPPYVHLGFTQTANLVFVPNFKAHYLGGAYDPFYVYDDPASDKFRVPNLQLADGVTLDRVGDRRSLLQGFDTARRNFEASAAAESVDDFTRAALEIATGSQAREAFDLSRENEQTRQRYGMHRWGQSCLLARRLVEAGMPFVTVNFDPHSYTFDMHGNVKGGMQSAGPRMDAAIPALVEDLYERGLDKRVLLIVWGEFGRTPKVNKSAGRDHWGAVMSVLLAGGGLRVGQVIGSSTSKGEVPQDRPLKPYDVLATMYRHLGIDPQTAFPDHSGRPVPLLYEGDVISELV